MREMIGTIGIDSKIEVFCPSLSKEELEIIVDFFYNGNIFYTNPAVVSQVSKNLEELFGFPLIQVETSDTKEAILRHETRKQAKKISISETTIKIERDMDYQDDFRSEDINDEGDTEYVLPHKLKKENNSSKKQGKGKEKGKENAKEKVRKNADGTYVCSQCGKIFHSIKWFKRHVNDRCGNEKFECPDCKLIFKSSEKKFQHIAAFHPTRKIRNCPFCDSKFLGMPTLIKHVKRRHPEHKTDLHQFLPTQYSKASGKMCPQCNETFESKTKMFEHYTFIHPEAPIYHCSICGECYITLSGLNSHVFKVHERKLSAVRCNYCGKDFENKENVKDHIVLEHQDKKYHCFMCEASYLAQHSLQAHIDLVHEGKRYQCTECGEVFETNTKLESHTVTKHDRNKLFQCPKCTNIYVKKTSLDAHIAFIHDKATGHLCPECGENFQEKRKMKEHILTVHQSMRFACKDCGKTYGSSLTLRNHIKINHEGIKPKKATCTLCKKEFSSGRALKLHTDAVHEKKRPFTCHLCDSSFAQGSTLKTHIKGKHKYAL
jgi:KRAB domain-containing zinc finger protein